MNQVKIQVTRVPVFVLYLQYPCAHNRFGVEAALAPAVLIYVPWRDEMERDSKYVAELGGFY